MLKKLVNSSKGFIFPFALLLLTFTIIPSFGQPGVDSLDTGKGINSDTYTSLDAFKGGVEWIYGFLVIVSGYLSVYIPYFKNINNGVYRVLAVAVVLGAGFYFGAGTSLISLLITYTMSTSFYEVILKLLKKDTSTAPIEA